MAGNNTTEKFFEGVVVGPYAAPLQLFTGDFKGLGDTVTSISDGLNQAGFSMTESSKKKQLEKDEKEKGRVKYNKMQENYEAGWEAAAEGGEDEEGYYDQFDRIYGDEEGSEFEWLSTQSDCDKDHEVSLRWDDEGILTNYKASRRNYVIFQASRDYYAAYDKTAGEDPKLGEVYRDAFYDEFESYPFSKQTVSIIKSHMRSAPASKEEQRIAKEKEQALKDAQLQRDEASELGAQKGGHSGSDKTLSPEALELGFQDVSTIQKFPGNNDSAQWPNYDELKQGTPIKPEVADSFARYDEFDGMSQDLFTLGYIDMDPAQFDTARQMRAEPGTFGLGDAFEFAAGGMLDIDAQTLGNVFKGGFRSFISGVGETQVAKHLFKGMNTRLAQNRASGFVGGAFAAFDIFSSWASGDFKGKSGSEIFTSIVGWDTMIQSFAAANDSFKAGIDMSARRSGESQAGVSLGMAVESLANALDGWSKILAGISGFMSQISNIMNLIGLIMICIGWVLNCFFFTMPVGGVLVSAGYILFDIAKVLNMVAGVVSKASSMFSLIGFLLHAAALPLVSADPTLLMELTVNFRAMVKERTTNVLQKKVERIGGYGADQVKKNKAAKKDPQAAGGNQQKKTAAPKNKKTFKQNTVNRVKKWGGLYVNSLKNQFSFKEELSSLKDAYKDAGDGWHHEMKVLQNQKTERKHYLNELNKIDKKYDQKIEYHEDKLDKKQQKLANAKGEKDLLEKEIGNIKKQIVPIDGDEATLKTSISELDGLDTKKQNNLKKFQKADEDVKSYDQALGEQDKKRQDLETRRNKKMIELKELSTTQDAQQNKLLIQQDLATLDAEMRSLNKEIKTIKLARTKAKKQRLVAQKDKKQLDEQYIATSNQVASLYQKVTQQKHQNAKLNKKLRQNEIRLKDVEIQLKPGKMPLDVAQAEQELEYHQTVTKQQTNDEKKDLKNKAVLGNQMLHSPEMLNNVPGMTPEQKPYKAPKDLLDVIMAPQDVKEASAENMPKDISKGMRDRFAKLSNIVTEQLFAGDEKEEEVEGTLDKIDADYERISEQSGASLATMSEVVDKESQLMQWRAETTTKAIDFSDPARLDNVNASGRKLNTNLENISNAYVDHIDAMLRYNDAVLNEYNFQYDQKGFSEVLKEVEMSEENVSGIKAQESRKRANLQASNDKTKESAQKGNEGDGFFMEFLKGLMGGWVEKLQGVKDDEDNDAIDAESPKEDQMQVDAKDEGLGAKAGDMGKNAVAGTEKGLNQQGEQSNALSGEIGVLGGQATMKLDLATKGFQGAEGDRMRAEDDMKTAEQTRMAEMAMYQANQGEIGNWSADNSKKYDDIVILVMQQEALRNELDPKGGEASQFIQDLNG